MHAPATATFRSAYDRHPPWFLSCAPPMGVSARWNDELFGGDGPISRRHHESVQTLQLPGLGGREQHASTHRLPLRIRLITNITALARVKVQVLAPQDIALSLGEIVNERRRLVLMGHQEAPA